MASLSLRNIYKVYPGDVVAVNDFNLEIEDKEFIVLVGPSGCGKSTRCAWWQALKRSPRASSTSMTSW